MTDDEHGKADPGEIDVRTAKEQPQTVLASYSLEPMSVDELLYLRMSKTVRVDLKD